MKQLFPLLLFLTVLLLSGSCKKDEIPYSQVLKNNPMLDDFDVMIDKIISPYARQKSVASVSIGVYKDHKTRFYSYGETRKGNKTIPDSLTIYEIGSITKTFTAILLVDYFIEHRIPIDRPINDFLPGDIAPMQYNGSPICINHLLNHTSGLPNLPPGFETHYPDESWDSTKVFTYLNTLTLTQNPGVEYAYSNLGMGIAGIILERLTGKSYRLLLEERITQPFGMESTKIQLGNSDSTNMALGYDSNGNPSPYPANYWTMLSGFASSGAIKSNLTDMIAYGKNMLYPENTTIADAILTCENLSFNANVRAGYDWIYLKCNGNDVLFHDGGTGGFRSFLFVCKSKEIVLQILFSNTSESVNDYANELALKIIN